jgi:hypothetical protein
MRGLCDPPARIAAIMALVLLLLVHAALAQQPDGKSTDAKADAKAKAAERDYPKEIRGYKLARAKVEIKKSVDAKKGGNDARPSPDADALIQFGEPRIVKTTPLGITLEVPVTVAAVKQGGHVDFLTFEDMVVNGTPVTIEDYEHPFDLPNKQPVTLPQPVSLYITTGNALLGALGEWSKPKETWPVTGRVYVFGRFKKFLFSFKRVVPVELTLSLPNPLKNQQQLDPAFKQ